MSGDRDCPCHVPGGCPERRPCCHGSCERFAAWKAQRPRPDKPNAADAVLIRGELKRKKKRRSRR